MRPTCRAIHLPGIPVVVELTEQRIDIQKLMDLSCDERTGAAVLFLGTTRRWTGDEETHSLFYEGYRQMAVEQMEQLEATARQKWRIAQVWIVHRLGEVDVGESSIAILVRSPHRKAAFEAAQWLIDTIKEQVPIWKKELPPPSQVVPHPNTGRWVHPDPQRIESKEPCDE
jgi:molybdopterin synthase catalytic subunit